MSDDQNLPVAEPGPWDPTAYKIEQDQGTWRVVVRQDGRVVRDGMADDLEADELLAQLKEIHDAEPDAGITDAELDEDDEDEGETPVDTSEAKPGRPVRHFSVTDIDKMFND